METFIWVMFIWVSYLFLWFIINTVVYFLTVASGKYGVFKILENITFIIIFIANLLISVYLIWIGIGLLLNKEILFFILYLIIGARLINFVILIVQTPFYAIVTYFSEKIEEKKSLNDIKFADTNEGQKEKVDTSVKIAKYFTALYFLNFLQYLIFPHVDADTTWIECIIGSFTAIITITLLIGIPYGIYCKIRYKIFLYKNKKDFITTVWKISFYVLLLFTILILIVNAN